MLDTSITVAFIIVAVAAVAPWWLHFDHAGLRKGARTSGTKRNILISLATFFSAVFAVGFVAGAALGVGTLFDVDGLAIFEEVLPLWLPVLFASAFMCARRHTPIEAP